jgi:hypothetical protein
MKAFDFKNLSSSLKCLKTLQTVWQKIPPLNWKSTLWKLITFYPNTQICPGKMIKLKLSNCDNTTFDWV